MKNFKMILILGLVMILMAFNLVAEAKSDVYKWKILMSDMPETSACVFAERWAKLVEEKTNGRVEFDFVPYGTLAGMADLVELVQMGEGDMTMMDPGWLGSFVPQVQVFNLEYLWPKENIVESVYEVCRNGQVMSLLQEYARKKNLEILNIFGGGWQSLTSNVPIHSPEDCKGIKLRIQGSTLAVKAYNAYGFSSEVLGYEEVYSALQSKLIDAQYNPMFAIENMSFYEPQDFITNLFNELYMQFCVVNAKAFDNLPKDLQKIFIDSALDLVKPMTAWGFQQNQEAAERIKKAKPTITIYELTDEEIITFKELGMQGNSRSFLEIGGDGAKEILDTLLADINTAQNQ